MRQNEYFPEGKLGERKYEIFQSIEGTGDGGLDRKSVLSAMDQYAEIYHTHKCFESWQRMPTYFITASGKKKRINSPWIRRWNIIKNCFLYNGLRFKDLIRRIVKFKT